MEDVLADLELLQLLAIILTVAQTDRTAPFRERILGCSIGQITTRRGGGSFGATLGLT